MRILMPGTPEALSWYAIGILSLFSFFLTTADLVVLIRQKRYRYLVFILPIFVLMYFLWQCSTMSLNVRHLSNMAYAIVSFMVSIPAGLWLLVCLVCLIILIWQFHDIHRWEQSSITTMSVKETIDILPDGICCYLPDGRILLLNRSMQDFCLAAMGEIPIDGEALCSRLLAGNLNPGCRLQILAKETVAVLSDGSAWKISLQTIPFEQFQASMMVVSDITEAYQKTEKLYAMQKEVTDLGVHLAKVNQEIVELSAEQEILNAKIRLHDELGANLLAIRHYCLSSKTEQELAEITSRLRRNIAFLKTDPKKGQDEYELLFIIAERMGLTITVCGDLPQSEPQKHMTAVAIHECATNTLRHAHGNHLQVCVTPKQDFYRIELSGNGELPETEIEERGGLDSLRSMIEKAGGSMKVIIRPVFSIQLDIPKEVSHAL